MRRELGRHIVMDSEIHHGEITFRGTRIPVAFVLDDVADGTDWDTIIQHWHGSITPEAIAEAIRLASDALVAQHKPARRSDSARA
ncbi:MAG: DUF433 domain-containing protein [Chloroflexota bacterium]